MKNGTRPLEHPEQSQNQDEVLEIPPASSEPTWFLHSGMQDATEDLMARYRASRNLPDPASYPHPPRTSVRPAYRDLVSAQATPPQDFLARRQHSQTGREAKPDRGRAGEPSLRMTFILAAVLASASGATVGFMSSQFKDITSSLASMADAPVTESRAVGLPNQTLTIAATTIVAKKPVETATLDVEDISGETNSLIPLNLHAEPALQGQDLLLKISGLPDNAYLTTGQRQRDKIWTITLAELGNAKLMIPQSDRRNIDVSVAAFEPTTGELAAPVKSMRIALSNAVVEPASAPPPSFNASKAVPRANAATQIPPPRSVSITQEANRQASANHLAKAQDFFKSGNITGARSEFEQAWHSGSPDGALGLARSFDPVVLAGLGLPQGASDSSQAVVWYERAAIAGKSEAQSAIIRLRLKPN